MRESKSRFRLRLLPHPLWSPWQALWRLLVHTKSRARWGDDSPLRICYRRWYQGALVHEVYSKRSICSRRRGFFRFWKHVSAQMGHILV